MVSILESLRNKYDPVQVEDEKIGHANFQFVGGDKLNARIQDHAKLTVIALDNSNIDKILGSNDSYESLGNNIKNVTELDISCNSLTSLQEIFQAATYLPSLKELALRKNKLSQNADLLALEQLPRCEQVQAIVLSENGMNWHQLLVCCQALPSLQTLQFCSSNLSSVSPSPMPLAKMHDALANLAFLHLDDNNIRSWTDLDPIAELPKLATLFVNNNPLEEVLPPRPGTFSALTTLSVTHTQIGSWSSIDAISLFPQLSCLNITYVPLFASLPMSRSHLIARCEKLAKLNSSQVSRKEREEAEQWYCHSFNPNLSVLAPGHSEVVAARLQQLSVKWNIRVGPAPSATPSGPNTTAAGLVEIELRPIGISICDRPAQKKKIPLSLPLSALRMVCARLFGIASEKQILRHLAPDAPFPEDMSDAAADMGSLLIKNGSVILIDERT